MSKIIILCITLFSSISFACKLGPNSQWNYSEAELAKATKNIVVARLEDAKEGSDSNHMDLRFRILKVKKGKYKEKYITIKGVQKTESNNITYGKECNFEFNYKVSQDYLIYIDTLNPHSIQLLKPKDK
jgi:hypothetical protein